MFLMKLNLEECGLWWEAAMICEVCVVERQQGDFSPGSQRWCSQLVYLQQRQVPSSLSFLRLQLFGRTQAMWFKCKPLVCARDVRAVFFALGSHDICGQTSTQFPGFQPKPSPHSVTSDTVCPSPVWADAGWGNAKGGEQQDNSLKTRAPSLLLFSSFHPSCFFTMAIGCNSTRLKRWVLVWPDRLLYTIASCLLVKPESQ